MNNTPWDTSCDDPCDTSCDKSYEQYGIYHVMSHVISVYAWGDEGTDNFPDLNANFMRKW